MKPRFPLYLKLLCWFCLNLLVLAVAGVVFAVLQIRLRPEPMMSLLAGESLKSLCESVRDALPEARSDWNSVLDQFGSTYQARFLLFRNDGSQLAGEPTRLPTEVLQRLVEPGRRPPFGGRPMRDEFGPGQPIDGPGQAPHMRPRDIISDMDGEPRGPRDGRVVPVPPGLRFVVRAGEPPAYWIGLPLPRGEPMSDRVVPDGPARNRPGPPATLVVVSSSFNIGGFVVKWPVLIWPVAAALAFSALFWIPLVRSITKSVARMQEATAHVAEGKFDVRTDDRRRDELGTLGGSINQMASRLDGFVTGQKRFLGDIAHELCSPIARMQMALGILEERGEAKTASYVQDVKEELQHMAQLVNELLSFSKASLGAPNLRLDKVPLHPLVENAIRREARDGAEIRNEVSPDACAVADPNALMRAVSNLLRNAIQYAGSAGPITVSATTSNEAVELLVSDCGPGVPESELPKLFDPFYRVDTSRTRDTGGVGLGLAIVKTCVESCRGTVTCRNRQPTGLEVNIRLPKDGGHDRGRTCTDFSTGS